MLVYGDCYDLFSIFTLEMKLAAKSHLISLNRGFFPLTKLVSRQQGIIPNCPPHVKGSSSGLPQGGFDH